MKALVFDKSKSDWDKSKGFDLVDVPKPAIEKDNEVIIKVRYAGVCGTDKGIWNRQAFGPQILDSLADEGKDYRIIGHEFCGEISELGSRAEKDFDLKVGDFVSCESHIICNECYQCLHGEKNVCTNEKILGISHDGGFAEFAKVPAHIIWKTDREKIRPELAAFQEPFGNAVHASARAELKGKTVAIFGLGPIGLFLLMIARAKGAKTIIGIEPNPKSRQMAEQIGIDHVLEPGETQNPEKPYVHNESLAKKILELTNGVGVDVSFEMAGVNSSVNNALFATRRGGQIILFGIKSGDFVIEDYNQLIVRGYNMQAIIGRQIWQTWEETKRLLEDKSNHIQEQLFNIILNQGRGTVLPIGEYSDDKFQEIMANHPKFIIKL